MDKILTLLTLQRQALEAESIAVFSHIILNETRRLIPYKQAIFWRGHEKGNIILDNVSGHAVLDPKSPYAQTVITQLNQIVREPEKVIITLTMPLDNRAVACVLFKTAHEGVIGGVWLESDIPFTDDEVKILEELGVVYAHALALLEARARKDIIHDIAKFVLHRKRWILASIVIALFPVQQTIIAPAEIVARHAEIVTAPYDGMLEELVIDPGEEVKKDQVLARMEDSQLAAQVSMAAQEIKLIELSLSRLQREALGNPEKRADLMRLENEIIEKKYLIIMRWINRKKSQIRSSRTGTAVFADAQKIEGKPVQMGDVIMMVADPQDTELLIRVPIDSLIPINKTSPTSFALDMSPFSGRDVTITSIGYEASPDADGMLTYKIRAAFDHKKDLRIGWQGTAKIKGNWTILSYAVLRRPLAALRHMTGF